MPNKTQNFQFHKLNLMCKKDKMKCTNIHMKYTYSKPYDHSGRNNKSWKLCFLWINIPQIRGDNSK